MFADYGLLKRTLINSLSYLKKEKYLLSPMNTGRSFEWEAWLNTIGAGVKQGEVG